MGSTFDGNFDLMALRSQIFEYLRDFLTNMPCSHGHRLAQKKRKRKKTRFLRKRRLTVIDLFKARGWSGHVFAASARPRTSTANTGYVTLFRCSWSV